MVAFCNFRMSYLKITGSLPWRINPQIKEPYVTIPTFKNHPDTSLIVSPTDRFHLLRGRGRRHSPHYTVRRGELFSVKVIDRPQREQWHGTSSGSEVRSFTPRAK